MATPAGSDFFSPQFFAERFAMGVRLCRRDFLGMGIRDEPSTTPSIPSSDCLPRNPSIVPRTGSMRQEHCQMTSIFARLSDTCLRQAMAQIPRGRKARLQNMAPILCLQDGDLAESILERGKRGYSIQVETAGEFRYRLGGEIACRFSPISHGMTRTLARSAYRIHLKKVALSRFRCESE